MNDDITNEIRSEIWAKIRPCAEAGESDDDGGGDDEEEEVDLDEDERTADEIIVDAPLFIVAAVEGGKVSGAGNSKLAGGCSEDAGSSLPLESGLEGGEDAAVAPSGMYGRD